MKILGIESTCDETGVGIVEDGRRILSNVVATSLSLQQQFGGVVPEVAAREQVKVIIPVIDESLQASEVKYQDIDAVAVAYGPGLIGSLLVGVETAKSLALAWDKPLIAVNHLQGHVYANWIDEGVSSTPPKTRLVKEGKYPASPAKRGEQISREPEFPLVALIVSGGHTDLVLMIDHGKFKWLGGTRDDAAGEAFDKVARILGLGYPGGPEIELEAGNWRSQIAHRRLPRPMKNSDSFDFSFSGLKTAVMNWVKVSKGQRVDVGELAYEFQGAITDVLVHKTLRAAKKFNARSIVVGGGVAANSRLRDEMWGMGRNNKIDVFFPSKDLSIDNGVMIAACAFYQKNFVDPLKLSADSGLHF